MGRISRRSDVAWQKINGVALQRLRWSADDRGQRLDHTKPHHDRAGRLPAAHGDISRPARLGYDVVEAFNEAEARRALQADRRIALVLLDVNVGGAKRGLELAHWITAHHPETKVLLAAAVAPEADGILVLDKPYRPLNLLQHIDALLKA
ncbi:response regulator [Reyranella soli]|uniref:Response regulatory domain-containing protein n=1 Tax=Reyranella soli TaxID=1230389 RepID=A0A512N5U5_9HYPH|nr:response regulator [Reyranella soli]GEP54367.1 hypothetical protein RSO01_15330 [Reyranella soli]